jgi:hypothetical protein
VRNGSGRIAASIVPRPSGPSICGKGISTRRTSLAETPFPLSHFNRPMCAIVFAPSIPICFPTRSRARVILFPVAATSADVGAALRYIAPAATSRTGASRDFRIAAPPTLNPENCASPASRAATI